MMEGTYLIYGYQCKVGKREGQWKVGITCQPEKRHKAHKKAVSGVKTFDRYVRARFEEGYSFEELFDYFHFEVVKTTRKNAELRERIHTDMLDALEPKGFNLKSGGYRGENCKESRDLMSTKRKGKDPWNKGKKVKISREAKERNKKRSVENELAKSLADCFERLEDWHNPKLTRVQLIEKIVLEAGEPLHRKKIIVRMREDHGVHNKDISGLLQRATGDYRGRGNVPKEKRKIENLGGGMYAPIGFYL